MQKRGAPICPYCDAPAEYVSSAEVYGGRHYGMIYLCRPCDAYVGVHKGTRYPLGRLANKQLREMKKAAHRWFDPLWKGGAKTRSEAYAWLAEQMGLTEDECHIGMFDVRQCMQVINVMHQLYKENRLTRQPT